MEPISILNDLSWRIGDDLPQMFIDGNIIPLSQHMINVLGLPVNHVIPLRLYFLINDNYEAREYNLGRPLTGIEILGTIKTFWDETVPLNIGQLRNIMLYANYYDMIELIKKIERILTGSDEVLTRKELPIGDHVYFEGIQPFRDGYLVRYGL